MPEEEAIDEVAPYQCRSCGYWWYMSMEPGKNKCPRCGTCVECV